MRKKIFTLIIIQALLAMTSAILFSKMSFVGRLGIRLVYKQYQILKDPVKTSFLLFGLQIVLLLILVLFKYFTSKKLSIFVSIVLILIGIIGSIYTYYDFSMTSHKHMRLYFHFGGYTFWFGWFISCFTILFSKLNDNVEQPVNQNMYSIHIEQTNKDNN